MENQAKKYLEEISLFSSLKNYALIIQKEFAPDFDFYIALKFNLNPKKIEFFDKLIMDLIEKDNILPFYNCDERDEFFSYLKLLDFKNNNNNNNNKNNKKSKKKYKFNYDENINKIINYRTIFNSLLDFDETSLYIINNNNNLIKKYKWESKTPLRIYLNYLEIIKGIYLVIM